MKEDLSAYLIADPKGLFSPEPEVRECTAFEKYCGQYYAKSNSEKETDRELSELIELLNATASAYISNFKIDGQIPYNMRRDFDKDMSGFVQRLSDEVSAAYSGGLSSGLTPGEALTAAYGQIEAGMCRLAGKLERYEREFSTWLLLSYSRMEGFTRCLFISEQGEETCERCSSYHGVVFSLCDVPIPPLHHNCRCELLLMKPQTELLYKLNKRGFIEAFYHARKGPAGGVYFFDSASLSDGITPDSLIRATLPNGHIIIDMSRPLGWENYDVYEHLAAATSEYVAELSRDGNNMLEAFLQAQGERGGRKWDSLGSLTDWMTLGIVSGVWKGFTNRHEAMVAEPNLYNIANAVTMGALDNISGAFAPEKPWSLEHWLDIVGTVLIVFSAYRTARNIKKLLTGSADDAADFAGLTQEQIRDIIDAPSGLRPDPSSYLPKKYIDNHLNMFKDGVSKIQAAAPSDTVGPPGGTYVMPSSVADELIRQADGNIRFLETKLGFHTGSLGSSPVRIDIPNPRGLRMPSGNEKGANDVWLPGGFTTRNIPEAVIDQVQPGRYSVSNIR